MPQVSVVMAVYNGMPYLPQAVESILGQTLTDFEFIIVNDASRDDTQAYLEAHPDPRLKIISFEQNRGQTAALNEGLRQARAPFIARQDADDLSKPERLAQQVAFLQAHPDYLLLGTAADLIDDTGRLTGVSVHPTSDEGVRAEFANRNNCFYHGSIMMRREVLEQVGFYREGFRTSQDYDLWLRIAEKGKVCNLGMPTLYQYRLHAGQMTFTSYYRMKAEWKLAEELAYMRAGTGDDSAAYEAGAQKLTDTFTHFIPTRAQKNRALAELWRGKGVAYMNMGKPLPMAYCLLRAFLYEPANPDFWRGVGNHLLPRR